MEDRYFSDKREKAQSDGREKYIKADYFDETFSLKFKKGQGNAQSFSKHEADDAVDDDSFSSFAQNMEPEDIDSLFGEGNRHVSHETKAVPVHRVPQSASAPVRREVAHNPLVNTSRNPVGAPVIRRTAQSERRVFNTMPGDPSRVPSGKPMDEISSEKARKKPPVFKIIVCILLVLIMAAGGVVAYFLNSVDKSLDKGNYDETVVPDRYLPPDAPVSEDVINILLIGSDERADGSVKGQRSDTMILLSIDSKNKQIKLASFLRDSYVYIPSLEKKSKMNAAYSNDGAQGVMDTIEYNFGVDVHDYISVDFEAFEAIVDLLGGVTVDGVTEKEARYMNREADTDIKAGKNHMNGYEALWYCRIRKLDSDFYRTQRQRKVLSAIIDKAKANPDKILDMLDGAMPYVTTSIPKSEIKTMGVNALSYVSYEVVQQQIPADGTCYDSSVNGSYVLALDIDENKAILQDFVYNKVEPEEEE